MRQMDLGQALGLAFSHYEAGRHDDARRLTRDIEKNRPNTPGLSYLQGLLALAEGQGRKAAQYLGKALAQTPDAPPPLLAMARAQLMQNRQSEAEALLSQLLTIAPDYPEVKEELGALRLRQGRWDDAVILLRAALDLRPGNAASLNNLGAAEKALGHVDVAALAFAQALDADPTFAKAHANLAAVLRLLKRPDDAMASASRAVELSPHEPGGWLELGLCWREAGKPDEALEAITRASERQPGWVEALWLRAELLEGLGRFEEAASAYRRVIAADPADLYGAALALARLEGGQAPDRAPAAFVSALYDRYAEVFETDLRETLRYRGPELLTDAVLRVMGEGSFEIMDLGCGTGLTGAALRRMSCRLDGVDLSAAMLAKAQARGIYDDLIEGDLTASLQARPQAYDLLAAGDVFIYLGDLSPVLAAAARALRPGGALAFSVEAAPDEGWSLQPSKRFAHSESYLRQQAEAHGFDIALFEPCSTRQEQGEDLPCFVLVLTKPL